MAVLILREEELRRCAGMDEAALGQIEQAFSWLSEGRVEMPPIMHIGVDEASDVDIKSAYVRGLDKLAVKLATGFFNNPAQGLPSASAMVVLLSAKTGFCEAVLLDNGYLTDLRTGLAGGVAARHLAPKAVRTVGVVGAGAQARYQVEALALVRGFERLLVRGRSTDRVARYVEEIGAKLGIEVREAASLEELVRESQVVVTTTPSKSPIIEAAWLHPGLHITAMGADLAGKQELAADVFAAADLVVCDRKSQCFSMGDLQHAVAAGLVTESSGVLELGDITAGRAKGRKNDDQITVCDLTGAGVQDTAIANVAYDRAVEQGMGVRIEN